MNDPLTYGFISEDEAHKAFLAAYLQTQHPGLFEESPEFGWRIQARNATEVENRLPDAFRFALFQLRLNVLFVGRDSDTSDEEDIQVLKEKLIRLCYKHRCVIFMIPVQCIEHWLWYLKWKVENPASTKNVNLEPHNNREAKAAVYGGKLNVEKQLAIANELLKNLDISYLESRSASFRHFHHQVQKFLSENETSS